MIKYSTPESQKDLFRKNRQMIAEYAETRAGFPKVKIALLSGVTFQPLEKLIEVILLESGFDPEFFLGDYNAYKFESEFSEELVAFEPDYVYIHSGIDALPILPEITYTRDEANACLDTCFDHIAGTVSALLNRTKAQVFINNIEAANFRINGNFEAVAQGGMNRFVAALNLRLADLALEQPRVALNDINYLATKVGLENWRDENAFFAFKQPYTQRAQVEIARSVSSLLQTALGKQKKVLVLDLDNTVWGGIIGDDGADNIKIGMDTPKGEAYLRFQKVVRPLRDRGIAFAVCSKNDFDTAKTGFAREDMHLKFDDFHVVKINWDPKSHNINEIRKTLNVGLDSVVFVDDSPFERKEIAFALPDVYIPDVESEPNSYVRALSDEYVFETLAVSSEDLNRSDSFKSMIKLSESSESSQNIDEYLTSLNMQASFEGVTDANEERVHQLINKTNQFNLTTQRKNLAEVQGYRDRGILLTASLQDSSSKYGLISVLWGEDAGDGVFSLDNWVMSCRVFNRKLEHKMFQTLCDTLREQGHTHVRARYEKSPKNKPVIELLPKLGFVKIDGSIENGTYEYDLNQDTSDLQADLKGIYG